MVIRLNYWALLGIVIAGALLSTLILAIGVRRRRKVFVLTLIAFICIAGAQSVFWTFTYPATFSSLNHPANPILTTGYPLTEEALSLGYTMEASLDCIAKNKKHKEAWLK